MIIHHHHAIASKEGKKKADLFFSNDQKKTNTKVRLLSNLLQPGFLYHSVKNNFKIKGSNDKASNDKSVKW